METVMGVSIQDVSCIPYNIVNIPHTQVDTSLHLTNRNCLMKHQKQQQFCNW